MSVKIAHDIGPALDIYKEKLGIKRIME